MLPFYTFQPIHNTEGRIIKLEIRDGVYIDPDED